ncbi:hypothetical protein M0R36_11305 [bacterium]|jgi:hypothetical protein|nr:hypothetical protein [bacterium]
MAIGILGSASYPASTGKSSPLEWEHDLDAGSNRIVVVAVGLECDDISNPEPVAVTYGGVAMAEVHKRVLAASSNYTYCGVFVLYETDLPEDGFNTVSVTYGGTTGDEISGVAIAFSGVDQGGETGYDDDAGEDIKKTTLTVSMSAGDVSVIAVANGDQTGTFTHDASQIEIMDVGSFLCQIASAYLIASGNVASLSSTCTKTQDQVEVGVWWSPYVEPSPPTGAGLFFGKGLS